MNYKFQLEPRDLLFLPDARPMGGSDAGFGANWPRPDQLWNAFINAFHRAWPDRCGWEGFAHTKRKSSDAGGKIDNPHSSDRFGSLKTVGPFPVDTNTGFVYYPAPLDLDMELVICHGTDLPAPLTHAFRTITPGKKEPRRWLSSAEYHSYLKGEFEEGKEPSLYDVERNLGIEIDAVTGTAVESKLYQAEYLRPRDGFRRDDGDDVRLALAFTASCDIRPKGAQFDSTVDVFEKFDKETSVILGGQQGVARLRKVDFGWIEPIKITSRYLRWTLLAPAVFRAGWMPGWCADSRKIPDAEKQPLGTVMLKDCQSSKLIAARISKPFAFSGWDLRTGPKPTQLGVPAGSCYVFDCGTAENAQKFADLLNFKPCSDQLGEKGFGIGVCSSVVESEILK